jgi:hypothetical protein
MSLALTQMAPPRIQIHHADGFVTYTIWPAGYRRVLGMLLMMLCLYPGAMFLLINPGETWIIGVLFMTFLTILVRASAYQATRAKASITIGPSDVIIRSSGWRGSGSLHWLRDEISDISARVPGDLGSRGSVAVFTLGFAFRREYALSIVTVPSWRSRALETLLLTYEEAHWLADALRRELELPRHDAGR